jgi:hypothetical protein
LGWNVPNKVISKECIEMANKLVKAAEDIDSPAFDNARPEIMRLLLNSGGERNFNITSSMVKAGIRGAALGFSSSLLSSSGMLISNILSVGNMLGFQIPTDILRGMRTVPYNATERRGLKAIGDVASAFSLLASADAKTTTNLIRYFMAGLKSGSPADIGGNLDYLVARSGLTKAELTTQAKRSYARLALGKGATEQEIDELSKAITLSEEDIVKFVTDYEYATNTSNKFMRGVVIGQRAALSIDEASKSLFRTLQVAKNARHAAIVAAKGDNSKVGQLQAQYFKEIMDAHEAAYNKEHALYEAITGSANFKGVREAVRAMESKSNQVFKDIVPEDDIPFETIREFALNSTFQRRLPDSLIPRMTQGLSRAKSKLGEDYTFTENAIAFGLNSLMPFAVTPYNIKMEALSYTPLAIAMPFLRPKVVKRKLVDGKPTLITKGEDYEDYQERALLGSLMFASIAHLNYMNDDKGRPIMTGTARDAKQREVWRTAGIPEQSILIGGTYVPYNRIEPMGSMLTLYTDTVEAVRTMSNLDTNDPDYDTKMEVIGKGIDETINVLFSSVFNTPMMEATANLVDMVRAEPSNMMVDYFQQTAKSYVPTFVSDLARMIDEEERFADTTTERIQQRIPGLREQLPVREQRAEQAQSPTALEIILKMDFVPVNNSDVARTLYRLEPDLPTATPKLRGVTLNSSEYSVYKNEYNRVQDTLLSALIATRKFDMATPLEQKEFLERELRSRINSKVRYDLFLKGMKEKLGPVGFNAWYTNFAKKEENARRKSTRTTSLGFLPVDIED